MKKSLLKKTCGLIAATLTVVITAVADETISANIVLDADADWRSKGTVTIASGVTVNLNGHSLKLAGLAGSGTIDNSPIDLTSPDGSVSSTTVFQGGSAANLFNNNFRRNDVDNTRRALVNGGALPLIVDYDFGEGNEQAVNQYKVYCGPIPGYTVRCPKTWTFEGSNDKTNWTLLDSRPSETGWTIANSASECRTKTFENTTPYRYYRFKATVSQQANTHLEMVQLEYFDTSTVTTSELWLDVPAGATVTNSGVTIKGYIQLVKDGAGTFVASKINQDYNKGTRVVAGTFACNGGLGANLLGSGRTVLVESGATFDDDGWKKLQPYEIVLAGGKLANAFSGQLTMHMDGSGNYEIQDGATLNLAERMDVLNGKNADFNHSFTFSSNATFTVNLAGRNLALGEKLIRWTAKTRPVNAIFKFDDATAQGAVEPVATDTGCFYGVDPDSNLAEYAVWTGGGHDGAMDNPENWSCTNVAGNLIDQGLPGTITTVRLAGLVDIQYPVGATLPHEELELGNCRLGADCDWRGMGNFVLPSGIKIELNGKKLYVIGLAGSGEVVGDAFDLTSPDGSVSSTTTFQGGSAANLFNNNFTRNGSDNARRALVNGGALPLVVDYDFGEGNEQVIDRYKVYCGPIPGYTVRCPKTWTFEGSNDKTTWTLLDSRPSETGWSIAESSSECRTKAFVNTTAYRYYRFKVTVSQQANTHLEIVQLEYGNSHTSGELHVTVPEGETVNNTTVSLTGGLKLVKEGPGLFVATKAPQTYFGGTEIAAGCLQDGTYGYNAPFGAAGTITVDAGGRLLVSCGACIDYPLVAAGGMIDTTKPFNGVGRTFASLTLTEDSLFNVPYTWGLVGENVTGGNGPTTLELNRHTLNVAMTQSSWFRLKNAEVNNGTIRTTGVEGGVEFLDNSVRAETADFVLDNEISVSCPASVHDLILGEHSSTTTANYPIKVYGTFKTSTLNFPDVTLQSAATLDLRDFDGPMAAESTSTSTKTGLTFADNATVTLDLRGRRLVNGEYVVTWEAGHENFSTLHFVSKSEVRYSLSADANGVKAFSGLMIVVR